MKTNQLSSAAQDLIEEAHQYTDEYSPPSRRKMLAVATVRERHNRRKQLQSMLDRTELMLVEASFMELKDGMEHSIIDALDQLYAALRR